jgi:hypothetical protein
MLGPALENNLSVLIKKRRYSAALHNVAVISCARRSQARCVSHNSLHASVENKKSGSGIIRSGAAGVTAPKLLRPWRWRFFWLFLVSTFRLPVALAVIGWGRRATVLLLLLLLLLLLRRRRLLVLLWRRRLTISALRSFSLAARLIRSSSARRRRDLLMKSGRWTSATLPVFNCASRWRRAESLTLRSSVAPLWRNLPLSTLPGTWLLA